MYTLQQDFSSMHIWGVIIDSAHNERVLYTPYYNSGSVPFLCAYLYVECRVYVATVSS